MAETHPYDGPRGFPGYTKLTCSYGTDVTLQQSSAAFKHRAWLRLSQNEPMGAGDAVAHLTPENARELIAALQAFLDADDLSAPASLPKLTQKFNWSELDLDAINDSDRIIQKILHGGQEKLSNNIETMLMSMLLDEGPGIAYGTYYEEPYTIIHVAVRHPSVPYGEMHDHTQHLTSRQAWDDFVENR